MNSEKMCAKTREMQQDSITEKEKIELSLKKINHLIEPFDLIAFKGGDIVSATVVFFTQAFKNQNENVFSHVGIAVNSTVLPTVKQLENDKWYIYESTISKSTFGMTGEIVPDVVEEEGRLGVQLRPFNEVVKSYLKNKNSEIAVCKLRNNPWTARNDDSLSLLCRRRERITNTLTKLNDKYGRRKYERNVVQLIASMCPCFRVCSRKHAKFQVDVESKIKIIRSEKMVHYTHKILRKMKKNPPRENWDVKEKDLYCDERDAKYLFCSELVAIVYKSIGVISPSFVSKYAIPQDFLPNENSAFPELCEKPVYIKRNRKIE